MTNTVSVPIIPSGSFIQAPCLIFRMWCVTGLPTDLMLVQTPERQANYTKSQKHKKRCYFGLKFLWLCSQKNLNNSRLKWNQSLTYELSKRQFSFNKPPCFSQTLSFVLSKSCSASTIILSNWKIEIKRNSKKRNQAIKELSSLKKFSELIFNNCPVKTSWVTRVQYWLILARYVNFRCDKFCLESIHWRPVSRPDRQRFKPLYRK